MKIIKILLLTVFAIFIITNSFSSVISENNFEKKSNFKTNRILLKKQENLVNNEIKTQSFNDFVSIKNTFGNIALSSKPGDESYPSMVINKNSLFTAYDYKGGDGNNNIYFRSSQNYGSSWSNPQKLNTDLVRDGEIIDIDIETSSPALDIVPNENHVYGSFVSSFNNSGVIGILNITNFFSNQDNWEKYAFDWSYVTNETGDLMGVFSDFSRPDTEALDVAYTPYMIGLIGNTTYEDESTGEGPATLSPMFFFEYNLAESGNPDIYYILTWYSEFSNCSNLKIANNYGEDTIYAVCEKENNDVQDLLFLKATVDEIYEDEEIYNMTFNGPENLTNPDIFVKNQEIYIVAETDEYGSKNILLFKSVDDGITWDEYLISDTEYDSKNPVIQVNETHLKCVYVELNNIISSTSVDGGSTWGNIDMLNDEISSAVPGYNNCDMSDMNHIVWTDNRNTDKDLYLYISDLPRPDLTAYNVQLVKGISYLPMKNWVSFVVQNRGSAVATDIHIEISYKIKGEDPETVLYTVEIPFLNAFSEQEKKQAVFKGIDLILGYFKLFNIEEITIHIDPDNQIDDSDRTNNDITIPVSYGDIYPFIGRFFG